MQPAGRLSDPADARLPVNFLNCDGTPAAIMSMRRRSMTKPTDRNDITLIRLAEMYLIDAEAVLRGSSPNTAAATIDLNIVRASGRSGRPRTHVSVSDLLKRPS
jgi:hypothetical protein